MRPIEITCKRRRRERQRRQADVDAGAGRYLLASTTFRFGFHHAVNENELSVLRFAIVEEEQKGVRIARRLYRNILYMSVRSYVSTIWSSSLLQSPPFRSSPFLFTARTVVPRVQ